jgi:hypothetical protein
MPLVWTNRSAALPMGQAGLVTPVTIGGGGNDMKNWLLHVYRFCNICNICWWICYSCWQQRIIKQIIDIICEYKRYFSLIDMDETVSVPIPTPEVLCGTRSDAENDCSSQIYVRFALRQQLAGSDFVLVLAKQFWALNWDWERLVHE